MKINCFRGDENNVLKRFIDCAETFKAIKIIRICSDNPFINNKYVKVLSDHIMRNDYEMHLPYTCYEGYCLIEPLINMPYKNTKNIFNEELVLKSII